jgi:TonB family protein
VSDGLDVSEELLHDLQKRNAAVAAALLSDTRDLVPVQHDRLEEMGQSLAERVAVARQSLRTRVGAAVQTVSRATSTRTELAQPHFVPRTAEPTITNEQAVLRALRREAEAAGGLSGEATIWFFVGVNGEVLRTQLDSSSGNERVDAAAWRVAQIVEFTPAYNRNEAVAVWTSLPIRFSSR